MTHRFSRVPAFDRLRLPVTLLLLGGLLLSTACADERSLHNPFNTRIPARSLEGGVAWLNTSGPLELEQLRGKFVLLDFWTYCCINCMHILPELKKLEQEFPKDLVVIGVHSAKFETERDSQNITDAIMRYDIRHPVVNDAEMAIWRRYGVNTWPTILLIDPEGNVVYGLSGEFEAPTIARKLKAAIPWYRKKGVLDESPLHFDLAQSHAEPTALRYPGKILADETGARLFIADSNHNRIVVARLDGQLIETIGDGGLGHSDGSYAQSRFNHPQGMALDGSTLYIADTENHMLRKVDLDRKQVTTIAGLGHQGRNPWPGLDPHERAHHVGKSGHRWMGVPKKTALNSPWDLLVHGKDLYIAMAGPHQIWRMALDESEIGPFAGNGREDIVDGPLLPKLPYEAGAASFAQPSGLASDGKWLYVADSEGSSIRAVPFAVDGRVKTIVGSSHLEMGRLFDFGDVDGEGLIPRLQHCLGVTFYKGKLYVADTYNNKIKEVDVDKAACTTLVGTHEPGHDDAAGTFDEPGGISAAAGKLYVADTNNHLIRTVDLDRGNKVETLTIRGLEPPPESINDGSEPEPATKPIQVSQLEMKPVDGKIELDVHLHLPTDYKINEQARPRYRVEAVGGSGVVDRAGLGKWVRLEKPQTQWEIRVPVSGTEGKDRIRLAVQYYYCRSGSEGLCKMANVVWEIPVDVSAKGAKSAALLEHWGQ